MNKPNLNRPPKSFRGMRALAARILTGAFPKDEEVATLVEMLYDCDYEGGGVVPVYRAWEDWCSQVEASRKARAEVKHAQLPLLDVWTDCGVSILHDELLEMLPRDRHQRLSDWMGC